MKDPFEITVWVLLSCALVLLVVLMLNSFVFAPIKAWRVRRAALAEPKQLLIQTRLEIERENKKRIRKNAGLR